MTTKSIARWVTLGALFLIPFLPLYVSDGFYFPFITGKNFMFRILVEVALAGWLVLAISDRRYRPRFSWTFVAYAAFVLWMLVAALFAVNPHKAIWSNYERMDGWITLIHILILLVVGSAVLSADNLWKRWWQTFIAVSAYLCAYGVFQMMGLAAIHQGSTRVDASLGNAEYFAGYLLFAFAVTLWQAFETRNENQVWLRWSLFALAALQIVVLFATGTRGTLIALVGAAGFGAVLWLKEAGKQGRRGAAIVLGLLILMVGGLFLARDTAYVQQNPNLQRLGGAFELKEALGPRITIWEMAIEGAKEKPFMGWGQEGYNYVFNKYYEPSLYAQEPWFDRAHNLYLDWLIAGGIPALLLFLATLVSAFIALYRAPVSRFERIIMLSALVAYSIQALVVFDNLFTYVPFVMLLGMAHMASSRPIKCMEQMPEVNDTRLDTLVAPTAVVLAGVLVWTVNVPSMRASAHLIDGLTPNPDSKARYAAFKQSVEDGGFAHQEIVEQLMAYAPQTLSDASLDEATRQEIVAFADGEMRAELERAPEDARLRLQYALYLRTLNAIPQAMEQSAIAHSLSPRKQAIIVEQGLEALMAKDYVKAKEFFTKAHEVNPAYKDPAAYIAGTLILQKDVPAAKEVLLKAYGTTTVDQTILFYAYFETQNWEGLIELLKGRLAKQDDANTRFQLAAAYSQAGQRDAAIAELRATIAAYPESAAQGIALLQQLGVSQ